MADQCRSPDAQRVEQRPEIAIMAATVYGTAGFCAASGVALAPSLDLAALGAIASALLDRPIRREVIADEELRARMTARWDCTPPAGPASSPRSAPRSRGC